MEDYKWIQFQESPTVGIKTKVWEIATKATKDKLHTFLGNVKWFGRWRKYAFFPASETVFEQDCLRDIANFCEWRTREYKQK